MDVKSPYRRRAVISYALSVAAALFIMLNWHEMGHTAFARLFGDADASYTLYKLHPDGRLACIGCNVYDETQLSFVGNVVVALGGVIFSQGMAVVLLWLKRRWNRAKGRFWAVLTGVCLFDALFQVAQGVAADTGRQSALTRVDIADFVWLIANRTPLSHGVVKGIVVAALAAYLWGFIKLYRSANALDGR